MIMLMTLSAPLFAADPAPTSTTSTASAVHNLDDEEDVVGPTLKASVVSEVMAKQSWAVSDCYSHNAAKGQTGRMTVEFHVLGDGTVSEAKVQASDLKNSALETCIVEAVKKARFTATNGPETVATFPFVF